MNGGRKSDGLYFSFLVGNVDRDVDRFNRHVVIKALRAGKAALADKRPEFESAIVGDRRLACIICD
jgi:hypothetical protein